MVYVFFFLKDFFTMKIMKDMKLGLLHAWRQRSACLHISGNYFLTGLVFHQNWISLCYVALRRIFLSKLAQKGLFKSDIGRHGSI